MARGLPTYSDLNYQKTRNQTEKYFPKLGYCRRCGRGWDGVLVNQPHLRKSAKRYLCKEHTIYPQGTTNGYFAMCTECWLYMGDVARINGDTNFELGKERAKYYELAFGQAVYWPELRRQILKDSGFKYPTQPFDPPITEDVPKPVPENFLTSVLEDLRSIDGLSEVREAGSEEVCGDGDVAVAPKFVFHFSENSQASSFEDLALRRLCKLSQPHSVA